MATKAYHKVYTQLDAITKATVSLRAKGVTNDELATVDGRLAQVVKTKGDLITLQVFAGTEGIPTNAEVAFLGHPPIIRVGEQLSGRFFNAYGDPIDGGPAVDGEVRQIGGPSVNPYKRKQPSELIPTGIAGIDLNNTLVSGQKIPFFADPDQPYNQVMADVALRADVDKIILGGMGLSNDDYLFYRHAFEDAGALEKIVSFVNTTSSYTVNVYNAASWATMEAAGAVFLPAAGVRVSSATSDIGILGNYWTASHVNGTTGYSFHIEANQNIMQNSVTYSTGCSVRLVRDY